MEDGFIKKSTHVRKVYLLIYIISSLLLTALTITTISLEDWFTYCYWDFGLTKASTILKDSAFKNEDTIADVRKDSCHGLKDEIQNECPKFCDYPTRFEVAGALILFVSIVSVIPQVFSMFYHLLRYRRGDFKFRSITCLILLSFCLQFVAFLGYYFISGFVKIDSVSNEKIQKKSPNDFEWKAGLILYVCLIILQFFLALFGMLITRKGFK
jgi:hypothetical protein